MHLQWDKKILAIIFLFCHILMTLNLSCPQFMTDTVSNRSSGLKQYFPNYFSTRCIKSLILDETKQRQQRLISIFNVVYFSSADGWMNGWVDKQLISSAVWKDPWSVYLTYWKKKIIQSIANFCPILSGMKAKGHT